MDWFKKKPEKSELSVRDSEDIIFEHINKIAKDNDVYRLLRLFIRIMDESPNRNLNLICSFYGISQFKKFIAGGFYQILSMVDYPFYPGDILLFSHDKEYKKGDTLYYFDLTNEGKLAFHYLIFDYKKEEGVVVRTFLKDDEKKYTVQPWQILGRMIFKYDFGSNDWKKFLESEGIDNDRIIDELETSIKYITDSKEFIDRDSVLLELNRRKVTLRNL